MKKRLGKIWFFLQILWSFGALPGLLALGWWVFPINSVPHNLCYLGLLLVLFVAIVLAAVVLASIALSSIEPAEKKWQKWSSKNALGKFINSSASKVWKKIYPLLNAIGMLISKIVGDFRRSPESTRIIFGAFVVATALLFANRYSGPEFNFIETGSSSSEIELRTYTWWGWSSEYYEIKRRYDEDYHHERWSIHKKNDQSGEWIPYNRGG